MAVSVRRNSDVLTSLVIANDTAETVHVFFVGDVEPNYEPVVPLQKQVLPNVAQSALYSGIFDVTLQLQVVRTGEDRSDQDRSDVQRITYRNYGAGSRQHQVIRGSRGPGAFGFYVSSYGPLETRGPRGNNVANFYVKVVGPNFTGRPGLTNLRRREADSSGDVLSIDRSGFVLAGQLYDGKW